MPYPRAAWERAMQVQEVILKALSGEIHWFRAAEILGMHPRSVRRWRERYEQFGYHGLIDKRYQRPSQRRVGIEHIPAYSPQARGRSERLNRTFQDRLVNELRVAGITSLEAANAYLAEVFLPRHNATFARPPRDPASAFVPLGAVDLDLILCHEESRVVARDNTVTLRQQVLQIAAQAGRRSCAGLEVTVRQHLHGGYTISRGAIHLGTFGADGRPVDAAAPVDVRIEHRAPTSRLDRRHRTPPAHKRPQASSAL